MEPTKSTSYNQKVSELLVDFKKPETQERYQILQKLTKKKCKELLSAVAVKGVVEGRTKTYTSVKKKLDDIEKHFNMYMSLEEKLNHMEQSSKEYDLLEGQLREMAADSKHGLRGWVSGGNDVYAYPDLGDLAGVRIGLYLPDDFHKVVKVIQKHFDIKHVFGTVRSGRNIAHDRNLDPQQHSNGAWRSPGLDGFSESWEHSGYKSWQIVVEWKESPDKSLDSLRVEIQIGTVIMHAWAEVEHSILYKRPDDMVFTPTIMRMLDAINGLGITTEIMLKELDRALVIAKKEADERGQRPFQNGKEFAEWFKSKYLSQMQEGERNLWVCNIRRADHWINFCGDKFQSDVDSREPESLDTKPDLPHIVDSRPQGPLSFQAASVLRPPSPLGRPPPLLAPKHHRFLHKRSCTRGEILRPCPTVVNKLIDDKGLLRHTLDGNQKTDIVALLIKAMGMVLWEGNNRLISISLERTCKCDEP